MAMDYAYRRRIPRSKWNALPAAQRYVMLDGSYAVVEWDEKAGTVLVPVQVIADPGTARNGRQGRHR